MDVVLFAQQNWDGCWTGKQHLATQLAARGHRVLYVDPDWQRPSLGGDALRALWPLGGGLALRMPRARLFVFAYPCSPLLPWRLAERRHPRVLRTLLERLGFERPVLLTLTPRASEWSAALPAAARVHYAIDEMTAYGGRSEGAARRVRAREEALVRRSHLALAISPRLASRLRRLQPRTYLLPSGADVPHFAAARQPGPVHPAVAGLPRPVIGFVGQVDERLDRPLVAALARAFPGASVALVGRVKPGVDLAPLLELPNVHLPGYVPFEALPSVLRGVDVALVPYLRTPLTESSSPLKVYEYLAADRPVVSVPLEGLGPSRAAVSLADGPASFVAAVERALADPAAGRAQRLAVAEANRWEGRAEELERRLAEAVALARSAPAPVPQLRRVPSVSSSSTSRSA